MILFESWGWGGGGGSDVTCMRRCSGRDEHLAIRSARARAAAALGWSPRPPLCQSRLAQSAAVRERAREVPPTLTHSPTLVCMYVGR